MKANGQADGAVTPYPVRTSAWLPTVVTEVYFVLRQYVTASFFQILLISPLVLIFPSQSKLLPQNLNSFVK
jgi:hypothetical protein